jgi:hypothetical protein
MNTRLEYLWIVDLEIYPNFQLNSEAVEVFKNKIQGYIWVLHQSGFLFSLKTKLKKTVRYTVDFDDPLTRRSFNEIPIIFKKHASPEIFRKWRLRIIESGSGNADTLRLNDNGDMFIGEHNDAWNEHRQSFERLLSEIDQVSKELT